MSAKHVGLALVTLMLVVGIERGFAQNQEVVMSDYQPLIGGCGGVYFLAEPGELVVEVSKLDRNGRDTVSEMRAILVGPDREVLAEEFIPDDGQETGSGKGPLQTVTLRTTVESPGIYALNITVSRDRYGYNILWGFRTTCAKYLVETARGHKDARHQEPIVLESPEMAGVVCFHPRQGEFGIQLERLPEGAEPPTVHDASGEQIGVLAPGDEGTASWAAPADEHRDAIPWQLRLPAAKATINIDGVTRWERADPIENACYWTPDPDSWFPFIENRWLLTPYQKTVYADPGAEGEIVLQVHNNATYEREFALSLEFPDGEWPVAISPSELSVGARRGVPVSVSYSVPDGDGPSVCHVRVTPADTPEVSTRSTLTIKPGVAPATEPLDMPIQLTAYRHENEQFGYLPNYPLHSQVYFSPDNQPYMRTRRGIATWRDGEWVQTAINEAVTSRPEAFEGESVRLVSTKIAFDRDGGVYLPASCAGKNALLHSQDGGLTFAVYEVPGVRGGMDIEQFSGQNTPESPPPFVRFRRTAKDPKMKWRSLSDLELFVPTKVDGGIEMGGPILITRKCIGMSGHSGMPSSVVSRGSGVHVTWGEATDPAEEVPGVPTYVVTFDRDTGELGEPALIGYGPPANDGHNTPSITMDGDGYLHTLIGTHGRPFHYCRSNAPDDAGGGLSEPLTAGEKLSMTYIGLVCGEDGTLHVVFRLWRSGEPYPHSSHATLAYQRKRPGQPWEEPRVLIRAAFSEYSIFYHRLTIDRLGRLFISYDYWSTHWFYRNDHRGNRRALLMSPDGGETWKMAETEDMTGGM